MRRGKREAVTTTTSPVQHLITGNTRPCPQCGGTMEFTPRCVVLAVARGRQLENEARDRLRYEPGWICRTPGCDHRELLSPV